MKIAAKPAVSSSDGGDERRAARGCGRSLELARLERVTRFSASSSERSLWSVNVVRRRGRDLLRASRRSRCSARVEPDAERQLVGQAAVDRDGAAVRASVPTK